MKRLISLFLSLVLLTGILPVDVLAAEDTFALTSDQVQKVVRKAGVSDTWHEGMSWSDSMSAYQKFCFLTDFRDDVAASVKNRYVLAAAQASELGLETETDGYSLSGIQNTVFAMESKLNYFIFDLETEINAVSNAQTLIDDRNASQGDKAAAYRRIHKAETRLAELSDELKQGTFPAAWQTQADDLRGQLDKFFDASEAVSAARTAGKAASAVDTGDASFHVIILNTDQIGIEVRTKDLVAIEGAEVTISSTTNGVTVTRTGKTASDGVVIFPAGYFYLDEHHRMYASLVVKKDGYRIWESESLRVTAGEGVQVRMEKDNGESYIQFVTFRGVDVAHDTEHVYYTPKNTASQSFRVGVHTYPGHTSQFSLTYTPAGTDTQRTITKTVTGTKEGITVLDLEDTWCSMLAPEELVIMEHHEKAESPSFLRESGITTEEAITEDPLKEITGLSNYIPGTSFDLDIPIGLPGLKNIRFSLAVPWELLGLPAIHFAMTTTGNFYFSIAVASVKKLTDEEKGNGWMTANSKKTAEKYSDFICGRTSLTELTQAGAMKDGVRKPWMKLFSSQLMASFCVILNGQVTHKDNPARDEDPYNGSMDLFFAAALDGTLSFSTPFAVGPVPCQFGFDLSIGIQAGLDLPFTFTTGTGGFNFFDKWNNVTFDKEHMDVVITPRVSLSAYVGAGVKGLLGIYIRGYMGLAINLHIRPFNDEKFTPEIALTAGVQIVADLLFFSVKATLVDKTWHYDLKKKKAADAGDILLSAGNNQADGDGRIHYVEPDVSSLADLHGVTNYRTVQVGDDFYGFWIGDQTVEGVKRPWLNCAKIGLNNGAATFTPVELPYLYVGKKRDKTLDKTVQVADFDVISTNDVPRHEGAFSMITVAVTYFEREVEQHFPNKDFYLTCFSTEFYNIVFFENGETRQYVIHGGNITDQTLGSSVTGVSVSLAFDEKVGEESGEKGGSHADYYYYMMYTVTTSASPTTVHYGAAQAYLTPGRPKEVLDELGMKSVAKRSYDIDFNTAAHPIEEIRQVCGVARGVTLGNNDLYVLATLKDETDKAGNPKSILIARDAVGDLDKPQDIEESCLTGDISAFRYIPGSEKEAGLFALVSERDEYGRFSLSLTDHRFGSDGRPRFTPVRDLGVRIGPASFDLVDLGASRALYYLETLSTDADTGDTGYNIRAIYLSEGNDGNMYASRSFHLASFRASDVSIDNGVSFLKLYADNAGFIQGFLTEKVKSAEKITGTDGNSVIYTDDRRNTLKYFTFRQTLQAEVMNAVTEQTLVKPGDTVNVLFSLMNTGNIPASRITLQAYAEKKGTTEKIDLADIIVNCEDPTKSKVLQTGSGLPPLCGLEAVSRYDTAGADTMDIFTVSENGQSDVYATEVLMPDETHTYRAGFHVPIDFTPGQYEIYVTFSEMTTRVMLQGGRYDAVSAWTKMLYNVDTQSYMDVIPPDSQNDYSKTPGLLTMRMTEPALTTGLGAGGADQKTPVTYTLENESDLPLLSAARGNRMSRMAVSVYNDRNEVPVEDADLSVKGRLTLEAGTEMVHVVIRDEGMTEAKQIVFTALVDGERTYRQALSGVKLGYQQALSFDLPLSEITGGREGENLVLRVSCDTEEINLVNNEDILPLNMSFMIIRHPDDVFIAEGATAEFQVRARGGKKPYTYQWQVSTSGQYGPFVDIEGAADQVLRLRDVPYEKNGTYYRAVVRDAEGRKAVSNPALLVVTAVPRTGDRGAPWLWVGLLVLALTGVAMLGRRKKRC